MSPAIADLLPDFGPSPRPARPKAAAPAAPALAPAPVEARQREPEPAVDVDAIVSAAVAKAQADVRQHLERLYEEQMAEDRARHEEELASIRNAVTVELGGKMAAALRDLEQRAIETTTTATACILSKLVDDAVRKKAVDALAGSVRAALSGGEVVRVHVSGPPSLLMPFTAAMGDHARLMEFNESEACDLSVSIDDTLFETRLAEWSSVLTGVSG